MRTKTKIEWSEEQTAAHAVLRFLADSLGPPDDGIARIDFEQKPQLEFSGKLHPAHIGQLAVWESKARELVVLAGTRSGKTSLAPALGLREQQRKKHGDGLVVSPSYKLMDRAMIPAWKRAIRSDSKNPMGTYFDSKKCIVFNEIGCKELGVESFTVWFGHGDDPDSLESMDASWAICDESGQKRFKAASKEAIDRRVAQREGRIFHLTTPYEFNWLKYDIVDKAGRVTTASEEGLQILEYPDRDPLIEVFSFESRLNPTFPMDEWERQLAKLPPWRFNMMYRGQFTRPAGAVLENFDENMHEVPAYRPSNDWFRVQGTDFGDANTAAVHLARLPGTDKWLAYGEYHQGHVPEEQHVATWELQGRQLAVGGAPSEDEWRNKFANKGFPIQRPPLQDRMVGYHIINSMFAENRLFISRNCPRLLKEVKEISYELGETGEPNPLKIEDERKYHLVASLRYACVAADGLSGGTSAKGRALIKT